MSRCLLNVLSLSPIRVASIVVRWVVRALALLWLLLVLAWAGVHWLIVPRIDDFRPRLQQLATQALGTPVSIGALRAETNGLVPSVSLQDLRVQDAGGVTGLQVPRALAVFSVASLLRGGLEQLVIDAPEVQLRRDAAGRWWLAGLDLSGDATGDTQAADWVFSQKEIVVRGGRLRWVDEQASADPVTLNAIDIVLRNGLRSHQLRLDATPEPAWGARFTLMGRFRQPLLTRHAGAWRSWDGQLYADLPLAHLAPWRPLAERLAGGGIEPRAGTVALRAWTELRRGEFVGATVDVALRDASVLLASALEPLTLASLQTRLSWRATEGGFSLATQGLRFTEGDGTVWPGGNVSFAQRTRGGELHADHLDLAALARLAQRMPLPEAARTALGPAALAGLVDSVQARWDGTWAAPRNWQLQAQVSALTVPARPAAASASGTPHAGLPGVEKADVQLQASATGGSATLTIADGALEFPGVFEEPRIPLKALSARASWQVQGERLQLSVDDLTLRNDDATGRFQARWHSGENADGSGPRWPGVLDLQGSFSRANGARVYRYLPLSLPAEARHYVRDAVQRADARDVAVRVAGKLREVPFNLSGEVGEFRFSGEISGATLAYVPRRLQPAGQAPWPPLEALAGTLTFERAGMQVRNASARVQGHAGWRFTDIQTDIDNFKHPRVVVQAGGSGPLAQALAIVRESPVAAFTHHALDEASASGDAGLQLKLDLPIADLAHAKVQGRVALQGNDLRLTPGTPQLAQSSGAVSFSDTGFRIEDARTHLLGGEARVSGGTPLPTDAAGTPAVQVRASGRATAEGLRQMRDWGPVAALAAHAQGDAAYEAVIDFPAGATSIQVRSDLRGLALDLPAPLAKPADAAWPLRFESGPRADAGGAERLHMTVGDVLALDYERDAGATAHVRRGAIAIGPGAAGRLALPASGVQVQLQLPQLDVDAWEAAVGALAGGSAASATPAPSPVSDGYLPSSGTLRVGELQADGRTLHDVSASLERQGAVWSAQVQARELAGRIAYDPGGADSAGAIHARLTRLEIAPGAGGGESTLEQPPARIPALDVVVDDFVLRGKKLGRLEVQATNHEATARAAGQPRAVQEWQLSRLALTTPEASLVASGRWATTPRASNPDADRRHTALDFKLDIRDAGALLARFGMVDVLRRGQGQIGGRIGWAGSPLSPDYASMDGQLHLEVNDGQFLKADPGLAKLLGVLSLQALPRRLSLDFRDVFSSGFAFDFIRGDAQIQRGVATTHNLQMKGVNAAVLMDGSADLQHETQNLRVVVVPELDAGTAALAMAAINPAIGLGAFLAQLVLKGPLAQATTREFQITGHWDNPQIAPIQGPAAAASQTRPAAKEKP